MTSVILYSQDQLMIRAFSRVIERHSSCSVQAVVSQAEQLLQECHYNLPNVIFLDMSDSDYKLIDDICKGYPSIGLYVVSFRDDFPQIQNLLSLGIKDYLLKPVSIMTITKILEKYQDKGIEHPIAVQLKKVINSRRFDQVTDTVNQLSESIYQSYKKDSNKTKQILREVCQDIINMIQVRNSSKLSYYQSICQFTDDILKERYRIAFQIFDIIDLSFREITLQKSPLLTHFYDYLDQHIEQTISLNEAAEFCHMHPSYLSRLMKERYYVGFNLYVQYRKIEYAKRMIYFKDFKIIDIAFQLDYSESSYFCKVFKKIEGITPMKMKKEMELERSKIS